MNRREIVSNRGLIWGFILGNVLTCGWYVYDHGWNRNTQFEIGFHIVVFALLWLPYSIGMVLLDDLDAKIKMYSQQNHNGGQNKDE